MSSAMKAAEDLKSLAKKLQPLFEVATALEKIGSLENATAEAMRRQEAAYKDADKAVAIMKEMESEIQKADGRVRESLSRADGIVAQAQAKASQAIQDAQSRGNDIVNQAEIRRAAIVAEALKKQDELSQVIKEISEARAQLDAVKAELKAVKDRIASIRA